MLILAGVSINAIVGDNGVLTKTTYASFLSEMSAVEEAVQLWKAGEIIEAQGDEVKAIPANGLCKANDLTSAERLVGEVGFYRVWSLTETMPSIDIVNVEDRDFNSKFESELVFYPAGVQDLYYLNNEALEIKGNKTYLIDATTGMIFSMTGISLNGVRCYSSNMAKAVMNGSIEQPLFAEAEVSGTGDNIAYAGQKYLMDKDGNYIDENGNIVDEENRVENPYGFQIIASTRNKNIYKLYNNGDLYGKGVKGNLLNTPLNEMENINPYIWSEFNLPVEIPGYANQSNFSIYRGIESVFIVNSSGDLYAYGNNSCNYFGLSQEQQIEYTGRNAVQINLNGKKVSKVFARANTVWVVTVDNELYACGYNGYGGLGIGRVCSQTDSFQKVEFVNPSSIVAIEDYESTSTGYGTLILTNENTGSRIYFAGDSTHMYASLFAGTEFEGEQITHFVPIFDGNNGSVFSSKIVNIVRHARNVLGRKSCNFVI